MIDKEYYVVVILTEQIIYKISTSFHKRAE